MENTVIKKALFNNLISVMLPDTFESMESEKIELMYPSEGRPQFIYEDTKTNRFCTFSLLKDQNLTSLQVEQGIKSIFISIISLYPTCLLEEPQLLEKAEKTWGYFSFKTLCNEGSLRNIMYILSVDGCMMLGTMGCLLEDEDGEKQLLHIMHSLEIPERTPSYKRIGNNMQSK
jgi:hypothetical protein